MSRRSEIEAALADVRAKIPSDRTLIVVTKTFPISDIEILYSLGERDFGENRDSEGAQKASELPADVIWHYQGEIQSQKIRSILHWSDYIHSLDELRHAKKIDIVAEELGKRAAIFLQINLDPQPGLRGGINPIDLDRCVDELLGFHHLDLMGVMGIAPIEGDPARAFARLQALSEQVAHRAPNATAISAGMSHDYEIALRFGATHLRVGSSILGSRNAAL
ncbi:MAG: YggS family pyridoxal phosphate-dependent enzyme [Actinobacteria bacterium]|nr:YggS family pyridoxal phosphate-dependent enzyme [Actinomycetota bacterium]